MRNIILIVSALTFAFPAFAQGQKVGFGEEQETTQGSGGKENPNANPENEGQTETTTTGPRGQLKQDNVDCNNCETTVTDRPGKAN
jgi:uncharacterized protein YdeI (BOF family)